MTINISKAENCDTDRYRMNRSRPRIGLALGSGGPRGLAHVGVIKVLEENNIPIDYIAGSSIGAMAGGFYAADKDAKHMERIALSANWKLIISLLDPSFQQGLLKGERVKEFIDSHLSGKTFDELLIPFTAIATNISNGEVVTINKGDVASAIRASISLPLVFKPVRRGDKLLADGGLSLPVPVDTVRMMGADIVIAVNLDADYFTRDKDKNPGFYKTANDAINILRHHLACHNIKDADIVINPPVGNAQWSHFLNGKDIISAGEAATRRALPDIRKIINQKS